MCKKSFIQVRTQLLCFCTFFVVLPFGGKVIEPHAYARTTISEDNIVVSAPFTTFSFRDTIDGNSKIIYPKTFFSFNDLIGQRNQNSQKFSFNALIGERVDQ